MRNTLATPVAPSRLQNLALWTLQLLLALFFGFAAVNKLLGLQPEVVDTFARLPVGVWFRYLVGVLELVGAVALVVPRLAPAGALWLAGVMLGAIVTHLVWLPPVVQAVGPAVLIVLLGVIARGRRAALVELLRDLR